MTKILICGPCVGEHSEQWIVDQAGAIDMQIVRDCDDGETREQRYRWIFKCSFDKANRTEGDSYRGLGLDVTLRALARVKELYGCEVTTDIHEVWQAPEVTPVVDIIQIPAMLSRQTDLIRAAARKGAVNIKVGTNMTAGQAHAAADKASEVNDGQVWMTYRGTAYGRDVVFDPWYLDEVQQEVDVIADITHSASTRKGSRQTNARVAAALNVAGLFIEAHPNPSKALSDGATQVWIPHLHEVLEELQWPTQKSGE